MCFITTRVSPGKSKKRDRCKNSQMFPLSETQYCPCDKYNAQPLGNWSDCILPEGVVSVLGSRVQSDVQECGQGYRYQAMVCYDQDNRLVESSRCNSHGRYTKDVTIHKESKDSPGSRDATCSRDREAPFL